VDQRISDWLGMLTREELHDLIEDLALEVPGLEPRLALAMAAETEDLQVLKQQVEEFVKPTRRFYDYGDANAYAAEASDVVEHLVAAAEEPSLELLRLIERALTLVVRAILRSDDSSGLQGDLARTLMEAHARAAHGLADQLPAKERRRLAEWLVTFRYGGTQDVFDPDVVAYAAALGPDGVERYRAKLATVTFSRYDQYAVQRLAVLDRDEAAILAAHGGEPQNALVAQHTVKDLLDADLHDAAVRWARHGLTLSAAERANALVDVLVEDALARGAVAEARELRWERLRKYPSSGTFGSLRELAVAHGDWESERSAAEEVLRERRGWEYLGYLLHEGRDDEAWDFARAHPDAANSARAWPLLCERRRRTHPDETLPIYRDLVAAVLENADRRNYRSAAALLEEMRTASTAAGPDGEAVFARFLAEVWETNRRRPSCLEILRTARLVPAGR
jgi:hypothetical protein